jgi:serine/threonine protein kinase
VAGISTLPLTIPRPPLPPDLQAAANDGAIYIPIDRLGEGAAGSVYTCARKTDGDAQANEIYAIKILCPLQRIAESDVGYNQIIKRFEAESQRGRHLSHPRLCKIIKSGRTQTSSAFWSDRPFYLMSYINGLGLHSMFCFDVPPITIRAKWFFQLADVLHYLHENGILHIDVKPQNIIIEKTTQNLFLTDYGVIKWGNVARQYTDDITTSSSEILTTWSYLAPEVEIKPDSYDEISEAWSFGKTAAGILKWKPLTRAEILLDSLRSGITGAWVIDNIALSLLNNEHKKRMSVNDARDRLGFHIKIIDDLARLTVDNYQTALRSVSSELETLKGISEKWVLSRLTTRKEIPEDLLPFNFNGGSNRCGLCGSYCVLCWIWYWGSDSGDSLSKYHYVCLGSSERPCGHVWMETVYDDAPDRIY